ncbi:MAG TPA: response regulator transcription factor [Pyrinomonadaceae bacterium]
MDYSHARNGRRPITISVLASLELVSDYLKALLESDKSIKIVNVAENHSQLLEMAAANPPDIALLCLMDDEGHQIGFIADLAQKAPSVKIIVLSSPNSNLDQPASLKLGVRGIVGANQNIRVLKRAIQQVFEGEVWLNQRLMDQLLNGSAKNGVNGSRRGSRVHQLTRREVEIIELVGYGMNNKAIAKRLEISEATVRHHLSSIYSKLHVEDRLNLAIFAYQTGIVKPNG